MEPGPDQAEDERLLLPLLDDVERARHAELRVAAARWSFAAAHALCRVQLSRAFGGPPAGWSFVAGPRGRPYLERAAGSGPECFSISHTRAAAASALLVHAPKGTQIGVDIEDGHRDLAAADLAERFFHPAEASSLRGLPSERQKERFIALWTIKEALAKAVGMGLGLDFAGFHVDFPPPRLASAPEGLGGPAMWELHTGMLSPRHRWAVALRAPNGEAPVIDERRFRGACELVSPEHLPIAG